MVTLSDRVTALHLSPIRRVASLLSEAKKRDELISFGGGAPSLPPPGEVARILRNAVLTQALVASWR
jgi:aspartate aminotransferase